MLTFKRCISLLLVLCLVLSAAPVTVHAVSSGTCGENLTWTVSNDGVLTISGTGPMKNYTYESNAPWYSNRSSITSVLIRNSVTTIGEYAFYNCDSLSSVTIGNSVTTIGGRAFCDCDSLSSVEIPDSVTTIGDSAFYHCDSLISVEIPYSVTTIDAYAFTYCDSLSSVEIPDSVTTIGDDAFWSCDSLSSVVIPDSVTTIGDYAFYGCHSLIGIYVDLNNPSYSSDDRGVLFDKQKKTLIQAPGAISGSYTIPDSVTTIGKSAFYDCDSLSSVEIPDSVTTIGYGAFSHCDRLSSVKFRGDAPKFSSYVFSDVTATAYYPANNPTWTADVMKNCSGTITWVPYTSGEIDPPDTHDTLKQLTDVDYMAFSVIAYKELGPDGATVQECLTEMGYWKKTWNKTFGITYEQLCKNIANWKFTDASDKSSFNGFYAAVFTNDQGEAVIAYRGSKPLTSVENATSWDAYCDWLLNDIPLELFNNMGPQLSSATGIYEDVIEMGYTPDKIALTGHSLGGAWADGLSAYSGSVATTFNAVSIL